MCEGVSEASGPLGVVEEQVVGGIRIRREAQRYAIRARSLEVLNNAMYNRGQISGESRFGASVTTRYRWTFPYRRTSEGCEAGPVDLLVDIRFVFPDWVDAADAAPSLQAEWRAFTAALHEHERAHECIDLRAAADLVRRLEGAGPVPTCRALDDLTKPIGQRFDQERIARHATFDEVTDHGAREGAFLR